MAQYGSAMRRLHHRHCETVAPQEMRPIESLNGSILAISGRDNMTQVVPRRRRIWSLSMRSSVQGPVSAATSAIALSTVAGKRP